MATVPELKTLATDLGLDFPAKIRKPELEKLIAEEQERRADAHNKAFVDANSTSIPKHLAQRLGLMPKTAPRNVPLTLDERARNYAATRASAVATPAQRRRMRKKFNKHGK